MLSTMWDQRGTPQNPTDWSDPDVWITERLSGDSISLARRMWEESSHNVNPRYIQGATNFANAYGLLIPDSEGVYRLTERGRSFLNKDPDILRELDDTEGILQLLLILAPKTRAKRGDFLPEWGEYLKEHNLVQKRSEKEGGWTILPPLSDGFHFSCETRGILVISIVLN